MNVHAGRIEDIMFYGDFMATEPLTAFREALLGTPVERQAVSDVISRFDLRAIFGGIREEEVLELISGQPQKDPEGVVSIQPI